jgi:hypothetical protein
VGRIESHDVWSFQHFHDIGLPLATQYRQLIDSIQQARANNGCQPYPVYLSYDAPYGTRVLREEWSRLGFPTNRRKTLYPSESCRRRIAVTIVDEMQMHPSHALALRQRLFPAGSGPDMEVLRTKVVWVSRSFGRDVTDRPFFQRRQISNEDEVVKSLREGIPGLEVFAPRVDNVDTVDELIGRLGDACLIMGIHGGHMYNQFFASSRTAVLEFLPVVDNVRGLYHGQRDSSSKPGIAHRAIWFNANFIGQPYWRLYFASPSANDVNLTGSFVNQVAQVVRTAGCG